MRAKGMHLYPGSVSEWLDCGNKDATVHTNSRYLDYLRNSQLVDPTARLEHAVLIPPCYIGSGVHIKNSVVGPYVSLGSGTVVEDSVLRESIVFNAATIRRANLHRSMLGSHTLVEGAGKSLSLGDYSVSIE
jgi:glucose-1-phosphate thymidylyltransferase